MCTPSPMRIDPGEFDKRHERFIKEVLSHLKSILGNHIIDHLWHHPYDFFTLLTMLKTVTPDDGGVRAYFGTLKATGGRRIIRIIYCPTDKNKHDIPGYYHYCDGDFGFGHFKRDSDATEQTDWFKNNVAKRLASLMQMPYQTCSVWYPKSSISGLWEELNCWKNNNIKMLVSLTYFGAYYQDDPYPKPDKTYIQNQLMPVFFFQTDEKHVESKNFQKEIENKNIIITRVEGFTLLNVFGSKYNDTGLPCPPNTGCP